MNTPEEPSASSAPSPGSKTLPVMGVVEFGSLVIQAFAALKDWGTRDDSGHFHPWGYEKRVEEAQKLVARACGSPAGILVRGPLEDSQEAQIVGAQAEEPKRA